MDHQIITLTLNPSIDHIQTVEAFSPFEKNLVISEEKFLGGKGINAAFSLGKLDADCLALGFTSSELNMDYTEKLSTVGVESSFVGVDGSIRVNLKIVDLKSGRDTEFNKPGFDSTFIWQNPEDGSIHYVTFSNITDTTVTVDENHPLAGKTLIFEITMLDIVTPETSSP